MTSIHNSSSYQQYLSPDNQVTPLPHINQNTNDDVQVDPKKTGIVQQTIQPKSIKINNTLCNQENIRRSEPAIKQFKNLIVNFTFPPISETPSNDDCAKTVKIINTHLPNFLTIFSGLTLINKEEILSEKIETENSSTSKFKHDTKARELMRTSMDLLSKFIEHKNKALTKIEEIQIQSEVKLHLPDTALLHLESLTQLKDQVDLIIKNEIYDQQKKLPLVPENNRRDYCGLITQYKNTNTEKNILEPLFSYLRYLDNKLTQPKIADIEKYRNTLNEAISFVKSMQNTHYKTGDVKKSFTNAINEYKSHIDKTGKSDRFAINLAQIMSLGVFSIYHDFLTGMVYFSNPPRFYQATKKLAESIK
ncbi:hypothetical protein [Paraburkholderia hayleyella]|uniref:hypothetical protein n=1 Tax=Paraburkholderia hayleyella TaxID=2152889 RepID=UPI001291968B|nr:hypothetical protein [Paraburkholderia hayleyella]